MRLEFHLMRSINFRPVYLAYDHIRSKIWLRFLICFIFISGCSTSPTQVSQVKDAKETIKKGSEVEQVADLSFDSDSFYSLLVAEIAIDRRRYDIALDNYSRQARKTKDINVVTRATQISQVLKARSTTLEMVSLWQELDPGNAHTEQILVSELIHADKLEEALALSIDLLKKDEIAPLDAIAAKTVLRDKSEVISLEAKYNQLVTEYPKSEPLLLGHSFLQQKLEDFDGALSTIRRAISLNPDQVQIGMQEAHLLEQMGRKEESLEALAKLSKKHDKNIALRARYARKLARSDIEASQMEFEALHLLAPNNADITLSLALVTKQRGLFDQAANYFNKLIDQNMHWSISQFHLGEIYERQEKHNLAVMHYKMVLPGQKYVDATVRIAQIMSEDENEKQVLEFVDGRREQANIDHKPGLTLLHAELLSRTGQFNASEDILSEGLKEFPNNTRILYARAMMYTKLDHIDAAEKDLKHIISLSPKNAAALNALGYTLVDKTDRIEEAYGYIVRAYDLTPTDPAVLDSLGWAEYKRGNIQKALVKLKEAMKLMPDHEIAAHLGEVLWVTGNQEEAKKVWKEGFGLKPNSNILHNTIHRLDAKLD